jgi:hypothetical protein
VHPRAERRLATVQVKALERSNPRILREVGREIVIACQPPDHGVDAPRVSLIQLAHGESITGPGALYECLLFHPSPFDRPQIRRLTAGEGCPTLP